MNSGSADTTRMFKYLGMKRDDDQFRIFQFTDRDSMRLHSLYWSRETTLFFAFTRTLIITASGYDSLRDATPCHIVRLLRRMVPKQPVLTPANETARTYGGVQYLDDDAASLNSFLFAEPARAYKFLHSHPDFEIISNDYRGIIVSERAIRRKAMQGFVNGSATITR